MEKSLSRIQKSNQKEQEGRSGKIYQVSQQQNTYESSLEHSETVEKQRSKKVNILEINGAQYEDSKNITNKMDDTLVELSFPQSHGSTFFELKQKEEQKTIHVNQTKKENYKKNLSQKRSLPEQSKQPKTLLLARTRTTMKC